jgi:hypothetical protein
MLTRSACDAAGMCSPTEPMACAPGMCTTSGCE